MAATKHILSPMPALVNKVLVQIGDHISKGQEVIILEAMKMENAIVAEENGKVTAIQIKEGDTVSKTDKLLSFQLSNGTTEQEIVEPKAVPKSNRIEELKERKTFLTDAVRPEAIAKRRLKNQNTARENIAELVDEGSFKEYGALIVAAQSTRRTMDDLIKNTPADGLITGTASINGDQFTDSNTQCLVMAYDFTVLAGTQGTMNHVKMDRMIGLARKNKLPTILFAEGGGGRPGDVDVSTIAGLYIKTFVDYAGLSIYVPTVAIVSGYCFAGNAALAGSSDIIIGTENISIGMGGPAMVEGGGLGKFHPKEIGPAAVQVENGVIDILVKNENEAIAIAKKYLSYMQGDLATYTFNNQSQLQTFIPDNRKRTYDVKAVINLLADEDSVLELKSMYGKGMITAFIRVEGKPMGLIANNSSFEAGAITSENAIKANDFLELCDKSGLPILSLVDTPGIMVGPEAEKNGTVKHASKMFRTGARLQVPIFSVVVRRAYGLGAMAMMGGSTHTSDFIVGWPTAEFGAMGLEGAVKLGYRKELDAVNDPNAREELYNKMVEEAYERGKAVSMATKFEIDDVIEPKETRSWISRGLKTTSSR